MRKVITGEQVAQLYNRDPFALPVWRAPVYRTPAGIVILVQLVRLLAWLVRLIARIRWPPPSWPCWCWPG